MFCYYDSIFFEEVCSFLVILKQIQKMKILIEKGFILKRFIFMFLNYSILFEVLKYK